MDAQCHSQATVDGGKEAGMMLRVELIAVSELRTLWGEEFTVSLEVFDVAVSFERSIKPEIGRASGSLGPLFIALNT